MSKVIAINISKEKGAIKNPIEKGFFKINHGLEGDAHAGNWNRQISLLGIESIKKMKAVGVELLGTGEFGENITTQGINLYELAVGTKIKIGEAILEVTQIGKECHGDCRMKELVEECIMPKEGIFAKVLGEGYINSGDSICIVNE